MRILFFSHYFPPEINAPATRTLDHCVRWIRAGHDVTVITCAPNCPDGILYPGYKNTIRSQVEVLEGIRVVRVWSYLSPNAGTIGRITNYVSYMISATLRCLNLERPDIVVATSPQFFCGWAGVLASRLRRIPLVLEVRDIWPDSIVAVGAMRNPYILNLLKRMERWLYRMADHVVTVGKGYQDRILQKEDVSDRISIIMNGVDTKFFAPASPNPRLLSKWNLGGKFICSYVGTIGMAHGLEVVLEAAEVLRAKGRRNIRFLMVGDGARRAALEARAKELELHNMVTFTGRLDKETVPVVLASSGACLVHLKDCELFRSVVPSKMFEIMAMGRPVLMAVRGEAAEIVSRARAGLSVEPQCPEALAAAVEMLADDPGLCERLGKAGRECVTTQFDRDVLARAFLKLLQKVSAQSNGTISKATEPRCPRPEQEILEQKPDFSEKPGF